MNDRIRAMQADAILRQDEERQRLEAERQRVRVNLSGRAVAPAAAAAADQARRRLGLPAGPVPDPIVEQEASIESTMQSLSDHHKSIRWLSSPPNAAVASDRVEELTAMEKASNLMRWNSQQAWNLPGRFIGAGVADYLGMGLEGVGIAAERVTDRAGASATGEVGTWQWATGLNALNMAGGFLRDVGEANRNAASYFRGEENSEQYLRAGRPDLLGRIEKPEGVAGFALDVAGGLGQVGGAIATAPISMPLLYGSGISQANDSVEEAQKREGREGQYSAGDDTALLAGGLVTGLSERLGINAIMGRLPKPIQDRIKGRIGQFLVAGATEGATEVAEGVGQNAISAALGNDQSILDGSLVYQGGVGAVVGSVANALIQTAIPGRQNQIDAGRAAEAAQKSAAFQQMVEASTNSELRQRSPERYESFLSDVTDGAEVFIPAEKVAEFFQSNADLDQWMDEWNIRDQVQEALVAGTDVVMPMATYLARVAPTEAHNAWVNDVRFGMGAMSANEASEFAKNNAESLAASIDLAIDSALSASPAIDAAMRVEADVRSQLREAGYTVDAANRQAALVASRYQARAEAMPDAYADAWQAYQQTNLTVRQEFPDIVRQNMDRVDVMLEALRRGRAQPSQGRVFGRSMMEFLSSRGGVQDSGGELAAMNIEAWHRPKEGGKAFRRRFTRQGDVREGAFEFDGATQAAIEAGYLPEGSTQAELLAAIREELAGRPTFSQQVETDQGAVENAAALDQLERLIGDMGLDLSADNATIKAALDRAADSGGAVSEGAATFDQAPADTNSPEFKAWFGDSKVVDESGNPLVVYHGTNAEFDAFDLSQAGQTDAGLVGAGVYLSPDARLAEGYGETVIGAYVSVTNPYVITDGNLPDGRSLIDAHGGALTDASAGALNDEIKSLGHDGVIFTMDGEISQVVAFDPTQIKSVNNRGTFDPNDPVIYNQDQAAQLRDPRANVPKVRGGWTLDKIKKYLKGVAGSSAFSVREQKQAISEFSSPEELASRLFYHGSSVGTSRGLRAGAALPNVENFGGGYGEIQHSISLSASRNVASNFTAQASSGVVYPVILRKGAKLVDRPDLSDAVEVDDILVELWEQGVDAVRIGDHSSASSEQEIVVLNPAALVRMEGERFQVFQKKRFENLSAAEISSLYSKAVADRQSYNQGDAAPRGQVSLSDSGAVIRLFAGRDLSTFTHEMGHVWLNELIFDATQDNAPQRLKDDLQTVLDWFSAEAGKPIAASDIGVDQHELWARGVERYVMEGKSPSLSLREVFRTMAAWMKSIYRTVSNLNSPISDEVRGVMDRLIATDAEIEQARVDSGSSLGADVLAQMGATDAEVSAYRANVDRARSEAEDELLGQVMRAVRRERNKEWREAADAMREEVSAQVDMDADLTALDVIKNHGAMDREAVVAIMGDAAGLALLPKRIPPIYSANGGQHPDMVAQAAGYRSGSEMLNALMDYQVEHENNKDAGWKKGVRAKRIEDRIREALLDRYGDILNDGSTEQEALDAIHSERYAELLGVDLQVLGRRIGQAPAPIDAIRQWARDRIGGRTVREIRPANYLRAERKASNDTQRALASNDREAAFRHKQAQAINNALYMASSKAKRETDAVVRRLRKLGSKRSPGIHVDYMEQIDAILEQFELRRVSGVVVQRRQSLAAFIAEQKAAGNEINIPPEVVEASAKQNIEDLTVDEIMALGEVVSSLEHLGRLKKKLKVGQEQRDLDRVVAEAVEVAERAPNVKRRAVAGEQTRREEAMTFVESLEVSLVKAQEFMRILDDGDRLGIFHAVLDRRGVEAADLKSRLQEEFWSPVDAAYKAIPNTIKKAWMDQVEGHPFLDPNTGEELAMKRIDLLGAALHVGTLSNFEKMAKGYGLIRPDADPVQVSTLRTVFVGWLEQRLDETEWDYVQSIWNAHERLRPQYFAVARDIEGYEPDPVEAEPVVLAGRTLAGGYAPISYNPDLDRAAAIREQADAADIFGGVMSAGPRPDNGSTNARSGYVGAVDLRLSSARSSAEKHITYTAYAEYVQNSLKFLRHPDIAKVMKAKIGDAGYNTFEPWIAAQVKADMDMDTNAKTYVKLLRGFRTNMTAATMLGSFTVLTAQPAGLAQSATHLGLERLARGSATSARLITSGKFRDFITSRSEFMRLRLEEAELEHEFRQAMKASRTGEDALSKARVLTGNLIAWVDFYGVSGTTWISAYEGAIAEGKSEADAAYIADHAVRFTQGGARAIDHAGIQRTNNEFVKATVMFYGWANAFYNMQRSYLVDFKNGKDRMENAVSLVSVVVFSTLLDAFMSGDWPDWMAEALKGEMPDDWMEAAQDTGSWFLRNVAFGALAGIPIARDIGSTAERKVAGEFTSGVSQTPMARVLNEGFKLGDDMWKLATEGPDAVSSRWSGRMIGTFGMALGLPGTTQIVRTTNYLQDVARGDQNPESAMDWTVGLLRGPQKDQK